MPAEEGRCRSQEPCTSPGRPHQSVPCSREAGEEIGRIHSRRLCEEGAEGRRKEERREDDGLSSPDTYYIRALGALVAQNSRYLGRVRESLPRQRRQAIAARTLISQSPSGEVHAELQAAGNIKFWPEQQSWGFTTRLTGCCRMWFRA